MDQSPRSAFLSLDIGAAEHAFCFEDGNTSKAGKVDSAPEEVRRFIASKVRKDRPLRVIMEATGIYYLDAAVIAAELGAEVFVVNPKAAHNFAKALQQRSKTDALDAAMLLEFVKRMPLKRWTPPSQSHLALRYYGRYLTQLTEDCTAAKNRLHALSSTQACPKALRTDMQRAIAGLERRIDRLRGEAVELIREDPDLQSMFEALISMVGVAETSAVSLLGELAVLPRDMSARACVCHAGLDVRVFESGSSLAKAPRITRHGNKYLRRALFHPALVAGRHDPYARAFKERLIARGKKKMQANVAVMRKLLTAAWTLVKSPEKYDGSRLFPSQEIA
ncbi:IS110 family transposase [Pseudomarimonas salicorniae]|uniref:IS110 family transposase n=1 Tax=Pseudomarimonas salicorniae TaxID=2933270 RepID=A0ABT0GF25_9GAMM|nr:IS110 family transposase [Lysobacter sp. CAU 1642]MCK7592632.1 IS110 family transposase [Lysobacter sp. CAU 1642]